ncbi:MAG: D-alanyl-D-alanine carboxypeptidase [Clostridiales bacterium]|nr:D-alanyl-D-alanine carboxypeptidase [Clostridiales bacterium]
MTKKNIFKSFTLSLIIFLIMPLAVSIKTNASTNLPDIISEAAIVMDYDTGEIIYEKNANNKMFLASTTKLMTALLFAENKSKTDTITYTDSAKAQPPYTMDSEQMKPSGKSMMVGDTLDGDTTMKELLLFSANDAAYMIADSVSGSTEAFVSLMNSKASEFGLNNTHFENPNGLPIDNQDVNYSTAYELAIITKKAFENDWVRETLQLSKSTVMLPRDTRINLESRNTELNINGNIGGKTGVTDNAGTCFAGVYERNGRKLIGVVLKCDRNSNTKRFEDLNKMMNYSYPLEKSIYKAAGEEIDSVELSYKLFGFFGPSKTITAPVVLDENAMLYDNSINNSEASIKLNSTSEDAWKAASEGKITLSLSVKQYSTEIQGKINLSTSDIIKANLGFYIATIAIIIVILILITFIVKVIKNSSSRNSKKRRKKRRY